MYLFLWVVPSDVSGLVPTPGIEDRIDLIGDATMFSTLHENCRYLQVEITEKDRDESTFTSHHDLLRFICMPFGLKHLPGNFQQAMEVLLMKVKWLSALLNLGDIFIFLRAPGKILDHVWQVLTSLYYAGVTFNLEKWDWFTNHTDHLCHIIHPRRLKASRKLIDTECRFKLLTSVTDLHSFLNL